MFKSKVFIFFLLSFFFWIFVGNILIYFAYIVIFLSCTMGILFLLLCRMKKHHLFLLIVSCGVTFGIFYSWIYNYYSQQKTIFIENYYNANVSLVWEVQELHKKSTNFYSYIVQIHSIDEKDSPNIHALMYYSPKYTLFPWDIISLDTQVQEIENFSSGFQYKKYLETKNIYFQFFVNDITLIQANNLPKRKQFIIDMRQSILENVYNNYPKDEAIFLAGILIGAREDMSETLRENLNNSGLTHLVAVSGFNITIIIIFLWFLLKFFPVFIRTFIICVSIIFFVLLVWDNIPVIRAWIMGLIGYFILISGRKADSLILLLFTAFLLVLYQPLYLNYDTSFHLSFLAVLGLLYFQDFWTKIFYFLPRFFAIKESFVLTMSALTTTLPIMIFGFWQVSMLAPITNMLVWWVIPFAMLFGFFSIIWNIFFSPVGFLFWLVNYFFLKYIIWVADFFGNLHFSVLKFDFWWFGVYAEILYFMILIFWIIYFKQEKSPTLDL